MAFTQFTNLDFKDIKLSIKNYLRSNGNFTDFDFEGSNLSVLIDVLAYNTYINSYNANMVANEAFIETATLRDNVVSLARNIGYVPRSIRSAVATIDISLFLGSQTEALSVTLKQGLVSTSSSKNSNVVFSIPEDIIVPVRDGVAFFNEIDIYEGVLAKTNFIVNNDQTNQRFIIPNSFVDTSTLRVKVFLDDQTTAYREYRQVDNIFEVDSSSEVFYLYEVSDERYEIVFGDGIYGRKLDDGNKVEVSYIISNGTLGNGVQKFSFSGLLVDNENNFITSVSPSITTVSKAQNGDVIESIESIKKYAPKTYASQYRAVTTQDYETVITQLFPNTESVTAYGGEELDPPQFGKVFICVKPKNGFFLSDFNKRDLKNKLRNYSVVGIIPEFVDLQFLFVDVVSSVYYNQTITSDTKLIENKVVTALQKYGESPELNRFGGRVKYSKILNIIDTAHKAITSNITKLVMYKRLIANLSAETNYEICYGNEIHVYKPSYNIRSTGFRIAGEDNLVYLADNKVTDISGTIFIFKLVKNEPVIVLTNVGTIDYVKGEILINDLVITETSKSGNLVEIEALPESNDIIGLTDIYVRFTLNRSNIDIVPDLIESGSNSSGTRFIPTSSYLDSLETQYIRK